jgi:hypothetical protein
MQPRRRLLPAAHGESVESLESMELMEFADSRLNRLAPTKSPNRPIAQLTTPTLPQLPNRPIAQLTN